MLKRAIEQYEQIARLEPKNIDNHILLGRLYRLNNDLLKAENEFKTAIQLQPGSEEAVTMLAYLYNDEGDSRRAAQVLTASTSLTVPRSCIPPSASRTSSSKYPKAIAAYKSAVKLDPENLEARRGLAQNLLNDNQPDAALDQFKAIVDANPHDAPSTCAWPRSIAGPVSSTRRLSR